MKLKLTKRKLAELQQKGVVRQELDGSVTQLKDIPTAPKGVVDNKNRSWRVHDFERDWDGYITAVMITEVRD